MLPGEPVALPAHGPHPLELVTPRLHIHHLGEAAVSRGIDDHVVAVPIENSPQSEPHEDGRRIGRAILQVAGNVIVDGAAGGQLGAGAVAVITIEPLPDGARGFTTVLGL